MRIISGKFKGHRLVAFHAEHVRPTTDRVKETLFNKLMGLIEGSRVLDLFSGTGNLGIEALSREAAHVDFVESHPKSLSILNQNLAKLKISSGFRIYRMDVFSFLKKYEGEPYQIIFADPPFTQQLADKVMGAIAPSRTLQEHTFVAIESGSKEPIQDLYPPLNLLDRKKFGDKNLSLFRSTNQGP